MKKIEIISEVKNGNLKRNRNTLIDAIKSFEGKVITITIKPRRNTRSNPQNRYYWSVINEIWKKLIRDEWGEIYSKEETHEFLKYQCNYKEVINEQSGEIIRVARSTTTNTTTEQEEFHLSCRQLALEMFNTEIPLPGEQIEIEL